MLNPRFGCGSNTHRSCSVRVKDLYSSMNQNSELMNQTLLPFDSHEHVVSLHGILTLSRHQKQNNIRFYHFLLQFLKVILLFVVLGWNHWYRKLSQLNFISIPVDRRNNMLF